MAEVTRTLQQLGMKICPVCGFAKSLNMNDIPVLLTNGRLPLGVDALGEYHEADLTFAVRMDCITCGHLMLFDAQRYRTGDEKILVLGLAEDEESPSGELPPLRRLPYERPGGTAAADGPLDDDEALPFLGLGFVGILMGNRRRALHDVIAGTAVIYSWDARAARLRFLSRR